MSLNLASVPLLPQPTTSFWNISSSALSARELWLLDVACALVVHFIYNRCEPQPIDLFPTILLLVVVPLLPTYFLLSRLQPPSSLHSVLSTIFLTFIVFYATLGISIVLFRVSPFHPLAKFPGPRLARISQLWAAVVISDGKRHKYFKKLHDQYGPYVRVGPNEVSCADTIAIPHIFGPEGLPKGPMWVARQIPGHTDSLIGLQDLEEHQRRRKTWNRAFSTTAVNGYERTLEFRASQLAEELEKRAKRKVRGDDGVVVKGETVDFSTWFSYFTFDFMGDMAFGGGFNLMTEGDTHGIWHIMESGIKQMAILHHMPYIMPCLWKIPALIASFVKLISFCEKLAVDRIDKGSPTKDLFHCLINEDGFEKKSPSFEQILSDASLAIVAGSDTTSTILGHFFFNILANPDVYSRLREEVDSHFPPRESEHIIVDSAKLAGMPYLNAVINEGMRLRPAVPINIQRATLRERKWIGTSFLPPGTAINVPAYIIHRDERNFSPLPNAFWPDRWLPLHLRKLSTLHARNADFLSRKSDEQINVNDDSTDLSAFIPFSYGPAYCAGKNLAMLEMRTVVSLLMRRFDMRFGDDGSESYNPSRWEEEGEDWFVFENGMLPVVLTCRD